MSSFQGVVFCDQDVPLERDFNSNFYEEITQPQFSKSIQKRMVTRVDLNYHLDSSVSWKRECRFRSEGYAYGGKSDVSIL